jgi:hypothetical protein
MQNPVQNIVIRLEDRLDITTSVRISGNDQTKRARDNTPILTGGKLEFQMEKMRLKSAFHVIANHSLLECIKRVAQAKQVTHAQVSIAWMLHKKEFRFWGIERRLTLRS